MGRWRVLWNAVVRWWKNEVHPALPEPDPNLVKWVRYHLHEYNELYSKRVGVPSGYAAQAAAIIEQERRQRAPTLESEVRVLAITLVRLLELLEAELDRQQKMTRMLQERRDVNL